jgi:CubicO group peptidase (beta-lactamase class C family)
MSWRQKMSNLPPAELSRIPDRLPRHQVRRRGKLGEERAIGSLVLAGRIVEKVTGLTFERAVGSLLFEPLLGVLAGSWEGWKESLNWDGDRAARAVLVRACAECGLSVPRASDRRVVRDGT